MDSCRKIKDRKSITWEMGEDDKSEEFGRGIMEQQARMAIRNRTTAQNVLTRNYCIFQKLITNFFYYGLLVLYIILLYIIIYYTYYIYVYICICIYMYVYVCICMYMYVYVCICMFMYMYIYIYV
jgi:hypothetical protein